MIVLVVPVPLASFAIGAVGGVVAVVTCLAGREKTLFLPRGRGVERNQSVAERQQGARVRRGEDRAGER